MVGLNQNTESHPHVHDGLWEVSVEHEGGGIMKPSCEVGGQVPVLLYLQLSLLLKKRKLCNHQLVQLSQFKIIHRKVIHPCCSRHIFINVCLFLIIYYVRLKNKKVYVHLCISPAIVFVFFPKE